MSALPVRSSHRVTSPLLCPSSHRGSTLGVSRPSFGSAGSSLASRRRQVLSRSAIKPSSGTSMALSGPSFRGAGRSLKANAASAAASDGGDQPDEEQGAAAAEEPIVQASLAPVLLAVSIAAMGGIEFGYHIAILNGPLELLASQLGFGGQQALLGGVISSFLAGSAIGALTGSGIADSLGRRKGLMLSSIPLALGAALMTVAQNFLGIAVGRFVTGLGVGLSSCMVPLYIAEVAPTALRGTLGSLTQIAICSGILVAQIINLALPAEAWRTMMALSAAPAAVLFAGMLAICPESPRYLAGKGLKEEARKSAVQLWGPNGAAEVKGDEDSSKEPEASASVGELFRGKNFKVAVIAFMMFLFQQFSGVNAVFFYSGSVFKQAGIDSVALANLATGSLNLLMTFAAASVIEKLGRKALLYTSFTGQGICMAVMGLAMSQPALEAIRTPVVLCGTLLYIMFFAIGCGPIPSLLIPEIAPERIRGLAVSLAMTSHWSCNFMVGQLFLPLTAMIGVSGVYYFFAFTCIMAILFTANFVVETKGRSFEEIEALMAKA